MDVVYHDTEWGVPVHDDRQLFEFLILEGAQAGLSWSTVLKKRAHYREVFDQFDIAKIATYDASRVEALLADPGIIRNRLKVQAAIGNARATLEVQAKYGSLDAFLWQFVQGTPQINHRVSLAEVPAKTALSDQMSKTLLKHGFKFVGSTICYAFMQAVGMVNDHVVDCFRYAELLSDSPNVVK
ncbi:DNA-3-methyladenine glycosylase I [Methylobacillus methanolivorans]